MPSKFVKVTLLGASGVGKSAVILRIFGKEYREEYDPSCEDVYGVKLQVDDKELPYIILDPKALESSTLLDNYLHESDGFLLIYSITSKESFEQIKNLYETIAEEVRSKAILIGNKSDLADQRKVSYDEGKALANELQIPFFETSAKSDVNITQPFVDVGRLYRQIIVSLQQQPQDGRAQSQDGVSKAKEIVVEVQNGVSNVPKGYVVQVPDVPFEKGQSYTVQVKDGASSTALPYTVQLEEHSIKIKAQEGGKAREGTSDVDNRSENKLQADSVELDLADIKIQGLERGPCCVML